MIADGGADARGAHNHHVPDEPPAATKRFQNARVYHTHDATRGVTLRRLP